MRKIVKILLLMMAVLSATSCITSRRVNYLQDMRQGSQIELENRFEATIAPYDEISIVVSCHDRSLAEPFNANFANTGVQAGHSGYLVDMDGNINFPILGSLHVEGLSRLRLQDTITHLLTVGGYIDDPFVQVRFNNFKIFVIGNGTGRVININNERCTFLEAIAFMGGLDNYTRRDRIGVMREVNGVMVMRYLDPRSSDVFSDPFFMLQQNDFIIMDNINGATWRSEFSYWLGWISTTLSAMSLVSTILLYRSISNGN